MSALGLRFFFNNADAVRLRYFNAPRSQRCGRLA